MREFKLLRGFDISPRTQHLLNYNRNFFSKCSELIDYDQNDYGILFGYIHTQVEEFIMRELLTNSNEIRSYYDNSTNNLTRNIIDDYLNMGIVYRSAVDIVDL
jgi:hypothetical protein